MENQLFTYKCICYIDGEATHRAGMISATSYGNAAEQVEDFYGPELGLITHLCALDTTIISFPSGSNEDLVDMVEEEAF